MISASAHPIVMVHFWGTWCEPCRDELPGLLSRARELVASGRFELIAVAIDDEWHAILRFLHGTVPEAIVRPETPGVHRRFGASTLPDVYLVDAYGRLLVRTRAPGVVRPTRWRAPRPCARNARKTSSKTARDSVKPARTRSRDSR